MRGGHPLSLWNMDFDMVDPLLEAAMKDSPWRSKKARNMPIDVVEESDGYHIKADVPGMKKEDITIDVDGDTLTLSVRQSVSKEEDEEKEGRTVHRQERSSLFVKRSLRMPEAADMENVAAEYKNGVINITVPKAEHHVAKRRQITVG